MPTFLVAVDFEAPSRHALDVAVRLARAADADLLLAHAFTRGSLALDSTRRERRAEEERFRAIVGEARTRWARTRGREIEGEPAVALKRLAKLEDASLVVTGSHGRGGIARWALGSVAAELVRGACCPVLVVRGPAPESFAPRVLAAVSAGPAGPRVAAEAALLARRLGGSLTLLHVDDLEDATTSSQALERARLAAFATAGVEAHLRLMAGEVTEAITRSAEQEGASFIAVGASGRRGYPALSVYETLLRTATTPVLVVRDEGRGAVRLRDLVVHAH